MATLGLKYMMLHDNWPGIPNLNRSKPTNGWDNTTDCCVTNPTYPVGCKIQSYNDSSINPGEYVMCYMAKADGSAAADHSGVIGIKSAFSTALMVNCHYCGTCADGNANSAPWYFVTSDCTQSDATRGSNRVAVACCSAVPKPGEETSTGSPQYGWWWIGGVCPANATKDLTWLYDASMTVGGEISEAGLLFVADDGTVGIYFDGTGSAAEQYPVGWSIKADA